MLNTPNPMGIPPPRGTGEMKGQMTMFVEKCGKTEVSRGELREEEKKAYRFSRREEHRFPVAVAGTRRAA